MKSKRWPSKPEMKAAQKQQHQQPRQAVNSDPLSLALSRPLSPSRRKFGPNSSANWTQRLRSPAMESRNKSHTSVGKLPNLQNRKIKIKTLPGDKPAAVLPHCEARQRVHTSFSLLVPPPLLLNAAESSRWITASQSAGATRAKLEAKSTVAKAVVGDVDSANPALRLRADTACRCMGGWIAVETCTFATMEEGAAGTRARRARAAGAMGSKRAAKRAAKAWRASPHRQLPATRVSAVWTACACIARASEQLGWKWARNRTQP